MDNFQVIRHRTTWNPRDYFGIQETTVLALSDESDKLSLSLLPAALLSAARSGLLRGLRVLYIANGFLYELESIRGVVVPEKTSVPQTVVKIA